MGPSVRTRIVATIIEYKQLSKEEWIKLKRPITSSEREMSMLIFGDIRLYHNGQPIIGIDKAYTFCDSREIDNNQATLFIGNRVAFDATLTYDEKLEITKLERVHSFCGTRVQFFNMIKSDRTINEHVKTTFLDYCTEDNCIFCKHWDSKNRCIKSTCEKNRYYNGM